MSAESRLAWSGWLTIAFATSASIAIATLLGFGYRATREWQRTSEMLAIFDTDRVSTLLAMAVTRDMGGVQARILANDDWGDSAVSTADTSTSVALAFTQYPYPESFFSWRGDDRSIVFFNRANRYPAWLPQSPADRRFPVVLVSNPRGAESIRDRIDLFGAARYRYVVFDTDLAGQPYQIVARLKYGDSRKEEPQSVTGFTVNLAWVRATYFADLLPELTQLSDRGNSLDIGVFDDTGSLIWGSSAGRSGTVRRFPLLFLNPSVGKVALPVHDSVHTWMLGVSQTQNSPLLAASRGASETLFFAVAAVCSLLLGLVLAIRGVRAGMTLTRMRSDFVSSVTHELKMPLANIRVVADRMARQPISGETIQTYSGLLKRESKRLARLIENLLAYARVTDVADAYAFEPFAIATLVESALQAFQQPLAEGGFTIQIDIPLDVALVRVDRDAMMLVLDNLLDNAIRYSSDRRVIRVTVKNQAPNVTVEVSDSGVGIPAEDLSAVQRKFVRGRFAKPGGSGLGLSIVNRIVTDHGGRFELESTYGVGTVARVVLPAIED